jgi:hypothetical protein
MFTPMPYGMQANDRSDHISLTFITVLPSVTEPTTRSGDMGVGGGTDIQGNFAA